MIKCKLKLQSNSVERITIGDQVYHIGDRIGGHVIFAIVKYFSPEFISCIRKNPNVNIHEYYPTRRKEYTIVYDNHCNTYIRGWDFVSSIQNKL